MKSHQAIGETPCHPRHYGVASAVEVQKTLTSSPGSIGIISMPRSSVRHQFQSQQLAEFHSKTAAVPAKIWTQNLQHLATVVVAKVYWISCAGSNLNLMGAWFLTAKFIRFLVVHTCTCLRVASSRMAKILQFSLYLRGKLRDP